MNEREALKLALEALEGLIYRIERDLEHDHEWAVVERELASEAITAIKEALAQPEQEPVAWMVIGDGKFGEYLPGAHFDTLGAGNADYWKVRGYELQPLYTTPPQRELVGLTKDEIREVVDKFENDNGHVQAVLSFVRAIEAKLKEKNT